MKIQIRFYTYKDVLNKWTDQHNTEESTNWRSRKAKPKWKEWVAFGSTAGAWLSRFETGTHQYPPAAANAAAAAA